MVAFVEAVAHPLPFGNALMRLTPPVNRARVVRNPLVRRARESGCRVTKGHPRAKRRSWPKRASAVGGAFQRKAVSARSATNVAAVGNGDRPHNAPSPSGPIVVEPSR